MNHPAHLTRYASLVDDLDAFLGAAARPLPRVVWANPLKADPRAVAAELRALCPTAQPVRWCPDAWRLPPDSHPGRWAMHTVGEIYAQEEAAIWAGDLIGAAPGERVLDLCAAPGGKTARMALAMGDRGTLVANDRFVGRMPALRRTMDRLGITSAALTAYDGARFPECAPLFDRVMVDAPCTCEGTTRKRAGGRWSAPSEGYRFSIAQVQRALLRRALRLTRPGGTVVYATCTYAPEENEGTLDGIDPAVAAIEPIEPPPGLRVTPGVERWGEQRYRPDVVHAARIWPHHNDTGGFFVARLRRL